MADNLSRTSLQNPSSPDWALLDSYLWDDLYDSNTRRYSTMRKEGIRLSEEDWKEIKRMISDNPIPVTLVNTSFGFSVGIMLWSPRKETFPGAVVAARPLVTIAAQHLPSYDKGASFKLGWDAFSPITHSARNWELVHQNELRQQERMADYVY